VSVYASAMIELETKRSEHELLWLLHYAGSLGKTCMLFDLLTVRPIGAETSTLTPKGSSVYAKVVALTKVMRWLKEGQS